MTEQRAGYGPPIVITGSQGCGKARHAAALARFFGAHAVEQEWNGRSPLPAGCVAFTNAQVESAPPGAAVYSLDQALEWAGVSPR